MSVDIARVKNLGLWGPAHYCWELGWGEPCAFMARWWECASERKL